MPYDGQVSRRQALLGGSAVALGCLAAGSPAALIPKPMVQTVLGPVPADELGFTLPHEHVLCDFIGAEETGAHRWTVDEVVKTMTPYLRQARERGVRSFVDCTPAYIGRDVRILRRLAELTGLHILTNTGYYGAAGDKYLPKSAFTSSADQLADIWVGEWERGIEGTGVKPGFLKIGVDPAASDPPKLSAVDEKIVRAAARASKRSGLTVGCHTGQGAAALEEIRIFEEERVDPTRLIFIHADSEPDQAKHFEVARRGAWVEYDAIGSRPIEQHVQLVTAMLAKYPDRLLLSMDSGWYWAGEPGGGKIRGYNALTDRFLPALRTAGASESIIKKLTVENPSKAFAVRP
jgi:predicted metal-dependent phosphotriesterase family hydrolase